MSDPREFTVDEANALVPALHKIVSRQMVLQSEIEDVLRTLHGLLGELPRELAPRRDDTDEVRELKQKASDLLKRFEEGWAEVNRLGAVVKDPRVGLVDFYGRVNGELVLLCWRFGEEAIGHYHGVEEGFAGRKPLPGGAPRHKLLS